MVRRALMGKVDSLAAIRLAHPVARVFLAGCNVLLPLAPFAGRFERAFVLIGRIEIDKVVLAFDRWRCPLTAVAARCATDRQDNFDICLPLCLARCNNNEVSGSFFVVGATCTAFEW